MRDRDALRAERDALSAQVTEASKRAQTLDLHLALAEKGFADRDEASVAVEAYWSRLPEAERPSVADWVRGIDPAHAPRAIAAYLSPAAPAASAPSSAPEAPAAAGLPAAAPAAAPSAPPISPDAALRAATARLQDAMRTRDAQQIADARREVERLMVAPARRTR